MILIVSMSLAGCAGRTANPVAKYQYGDEQKSCEHLRAELSELENDIKTKTKAKDNTEGGNVALAVTGAILFWPALFFMDLSESDQIELDALRKRYNFLVRLSQDKTCGLPYLTMKAPPKPEEAKSDRPVFSDGKVEH